MDLKTEWVEIIEELIADPGASMQNIANRTNIPKSTVWYTQKRLEEEDILSTITFPHIDKISDLKLGLVGGAINGNKSDVLPKVSDHPNVWFLVDTVGPHSFTAGIVGKDDKEFQRVIEDLREYGAEGDHYGEILNIESFGVDKDFIKTLI